MHYKEINNDQEKLDLLGDMVRLQNQVGVSSFEWALRIKYWFIEMPTKWTILEKDGLLDKNMAELWIDENGMWEHSHGKKTKHNLLGMAFAWWASNKNPVIEEIFLSDSPDFVGSLKSDSNANSASAFHGDIGKCTPNAIMNGMTYIHDIHDLWISFLDWNRQVIIEFFYSPSAWIMSNFDGLFGKKPSSVEINKRLREVFFCRKCNNYHIEDKARKLFLEDLKFKMGPNTEQANKAN